MTEQAKPRAVGLNHIALEVGDIEEALGFYGRLFRFELRGKSDTMTFIDLSFRSNALSPYMTPFFERPCAICRVRQSPGRTSSDCH